MVERRNRGETGTGQAERPPMTTEQFEASPEFLSFKKAMKKIMKVSKSELDARVRRAKETSPRFGNPNAAGRKPNIRG